MLNLIKIPLLLVIIGVPIYIIIFILIIVKSNDYDYLDPDNIDYILVLGCRVREDGSGSEALIARLNKTLEIAAKTEIDIILSGGQGNDEPISESQFMYNYLIEHGIDKNRLIMETLSTSTYENLLYSKKFISMDQQGLIITNNFHVLRVNMLAKQLGYHTYITPANVELDRSYFREVFAVVKSFLVDR